MKKIYAAVMITALIAILVTSVPASATENGNHFTSTSKSHEKSYELTLFAGYNYFESQQNLQDELAYGLRLGYNFSKRWSIEGTMNFVGTNVDNKSLVGASEGQYRSPMNNVDLSFYHIDAVYQFKPDEKFTPFVSVGFGAIHYSPKISDKDMATIGLGVGAKYWLNKDFALRLDVRDDMVGEMFDHSYHNLGITFGIVYAYW